jgi:hypothetical protein
MLTQSIDSAPLDILHRKRDLFIFVPPGKDIKQRKKMVREWDCCMRPVS